MKHKIFHAALGSVLLLLGACSEGKYWDEPGDFGTTPVFPKPSQTMVYSVNDEIPSTFNVTIARATAGPAATVAVEIVVNEASASVFSGPAEVSFEAGALTTEYPISINEDNMALGTNYSIKLNLAVPENAPVKYPAGNMSYTLTMMQDYNWVSAGTAQCYSDWVGNSETEVPIAVQVQEAGGYSVEGQRLFRLVSPYFIMEPDYAEEGYNIQFITTTSGEAVMLSPTWQPIGEESDGMWFYVGTGYPGCSFFSEGDTYVINGLMAYTEGRDGTSLSPYNYEVFIFEWTCPAQ